ncbi:hypothetical protein Dimus_035039 [Dionaea muscipula]
MLVLPSIIHLSQSAFVKGRSIVDNILLCQELMCGYERKNISPRCLARVDIRKAYDSVSWSFVGSLLDALGFPQKFKQWLMFLTGGCCSSPDEIEVARAALGMEGLDGEGYTWENGACLSTKEMIGGLGVWHLARAKLKNFQRMCCASW